MTVHESTASAALLGSDSNAAQRQVTLWLEKSRDDRRFAVTTTIMLGVGPPRSAEHCAKGDHFSAVGVFVVPIAPQSGGIALLLVLPHAAGRASLNHLFVDSGAHLVRHADRIEVDGHVYWISVVLRAQETSYDPAVHGEEAYCYLTKARLRTGQRIALCPGMPGHSCGVLYKAEAWEMALEAEPPMPCANCGFHPHKMNWTPPPMRQAAPPAQRFEFLRRIHA